MIVTNSQAVWFYGALGARSEERKMERMTETI